MTTQEYNRFEKCRVSFKAYCKEALELFGEEYVKPSLPAIPTSSSLAREIEKTIEPKSFYTVDTPIVYNHSLDYVKASDSVKLILVGDNPGKEEQKHSNQRYLIGQAGRIAEGFFRKHPELKIDFRKNVVILNKSIIHTPKTLGLKKLLKSNFIVKNNITIKDFLFQDEIKQARLALELQAIFNCPLWVVGYSELGERGIFKDYSTILKKETRDIPKLFLYQHFSMNCFIKQLKANYNESLNLEENLILIGTNNRKKILMF